MTIEIKPGDNNENYGLALREAQRYINELQQENRKLKEAWGKVKENILTIQNDGNSFINIPYLLEKIIDKHLREVENEG